MLKRPFSFLFCLLYASAFFLMPAADLRAEESFLFEDEQERENTIEEYVPGVQSNVLYLFSEHLAGAEAVTFLQKKNPHQASFKEDALRFAGMDDEAQITLVPAISSSGEDTGLKALRFNPMRKTVRRLTFPDVLPGSQIEFYYKISRAEKPQGNEYFYLNLYTGKHELKKYRLTAVESGWKHESFQVPLISFLKRNVPFTLIVSSEEVESTHFDFFAAVYS